MLRLAIRVVPPSDTCGNNSIRGVWRLVARVPRQAVWKSFAPSNSCGAAGDFLMKQTLCFACFRCAWSTRLWAISQGSDVGVFLELWLWMEGNTGIL
ncbi:hypothetical protein DEO72_LG4g611 [Vigna unguiculata]|uniref:Uncharacterized protein n=1 Tax=Vigna unguiculata TaxID=3917 RepID=A0A4D6LMT9_VIGUN|nr:hypothetical protein DEO72_LG4g611 [Vigna unguiculata]